MRIFLKQAEIAIAIGLYMANRGLAMDPAQPLDITFAQTRANGGGITAEFEAPDFVPVKAEPKQTIETPFLLDAGTVLLNQAAVEPLTNQIRPETPAEQSALLDQHQSGEAGVAEVLSTATLSTNLGEAISETTSVLDPVTDLNQALEGNAAAVLDPVAADTDALAETQADPANDEVAPVADAKSLFG